MKIKIKNFVNVVLISLTHFFLQYKSAIWRREREICLCPVPSLCTVYCQLCFCWNRYVLLKTKFHYQIIHVKRETMLYNKPRRSLYLLSPGQMDSQVDTSQRKFAKPELAYGLAKGGQTDSQIGSQITESRKFHAYDWLMRFYNNRLLAINLCWFAVGDQTVKNLRPLASKFVLDQSQRKSSQVDASGWPNEMQVECKSKTCVDLRVRLARA